MLSLESGPNWVTPPYPQYHRNWSCQTEWPRSRHFYDGYHRRVVTPRANFDKSDNTSLIILRQLHGTLTPTSSSPSMCVCLGGCVDMVPAAFVVMFSRSFFSRPFFLAVPFRSVLLVITSFSDPFAKFSFRSLLFHSKREGGKRQHQNHRARAKLKQIYRLFNWANVCVCVLVGVNTKKTRY